MNRITLSFFFLFAFIAILVEPTESQNYRLIDLNGSSTGPPSIDYFVMDILDGRELQSAIGMVKSDQEDEVILIDFVSGFQNELTKYFHLVYPKEEGKIPVILYFKKLWVSEVTKDGMTFSKCEISMVFLTSKKQKFYECFHENEMKLVSVQETHSGNIIETLNKCLHYLVDSDIRNSYYNVVNSNMPATPIQVNKQDENSNQKDIQKQNEKGSKVKNEYPAPKSRIAFQGGFTYRFAKIPESQEKELVEHLQRLKTGYNIGLDFNFFWNPNNSVGFNGSFSQAESTLQDVALVDEDGNILALGDMTEDIKLYYIGPSYFYRHIYDNSKIHLLSGFTIGYYNFSEMVDWLGESLYIRGETVGFGFALGFDFATSHIVAIGVQASVLFGKLNKFKIGNNVIELEDSESLSRVDLTIGFRILH